MHYFQSLIPTRKLMKKKFKVLGNNGSCSIVKAWNKESISIQHYLTAPWGLRLQKRCWFRKVHQHMPNIEHWRWVCSHLWLEKHWNILILRFKFDYNKKPLLLKTLTWNVGVLMTFPNDSKLQSITNREPSGYPSRKARWPTGLVYWNWSKLNSVKC